MRHILPELFPTPEASLTREGENIEHTTQLRGNLDTVWHQFSLCLSLVFPTRLPAHCCCHHDFAPPQSLKQTADMELGVSVITSELARLPSMMVVGDEYQTSSTRPEPAQHPSHAPHLRHEPSTVPSVRGAQATPVIVAPHSQDGPHIRFRGAPSDFHQQAEEHPYDPRNHLSHEPRLASDSDMPPPSPRLEPTHRSAVSLNGSVANSPSRIKVRDLGHIQSFASEEVLIRSRHPSRHSLRGRLAGGQQYEISSMPVGDIIEMVAGLLTKITTTVIRPRMSYFVWL